MKHSYIVTGSGGLLGSELTKVIKKNNGVVCFLLRKDLDLSLGFLTLLNKIKKMDCSALIHCAANTDVDECEKNLEYCNRINYLLTEVLSIICEKLSMKFIFISSTGVYGRDKDRAYIESDSISPTTNHHKAKYLAEVSSINLCPNSLVVRTGWLFGGKVDSKRNFVANRIRDAIQSNGFIYADKNQKGNPSFVSDVAERILILAEDDLNGVFNCVNVGVASRFDYVKKIISFYDSLSDISIIEGEFNRTAPVSNNESAENYKMNLLGYPEMRKWEDALFYYLNYEFGELEFI